MNRGDRREAIFSDDQDRRLFLDTLAQACEKTDWQVHAYVLMGNHFHLVVETPQPNLCIGMTWLLRTGRGQFQLFTLAMREAGGQPGWYGQTVAHLEFV